MLFRDRRDAGKKLALGLAHYAHLPDAVVLALPRGGVPVAYEVAHALYVPLKIFVVRKLGVPGHEELAMGAIAAGGVQVLNEDVIQSLGISDALIAEVAGRELFELERRARVYHNAAVLDVEGKVAIVVDDGLATGSTMRAAVAALRQMAPMRIVIAVPVAASQTCDLLRPEVDELICLTTPEPFYAVGYWYEEFSATSDEEILDLLHRHNEGLQPPAEI